MKFNPHQRYTRWSIRRLNVGVASVVVASGFFVLVGQPSSVRADVVNPTPAQVVPDAASVSAKSDLPVELLKEAVDTALSSEQADSTPKASLDTTNSSEKADAKDQVVAPKEEVQAKPESKKQAEDAVKPVASPAPKVSGQDREASEAQPATTPAEVQKGVADNTKDTVDVPAAYLEKATASGPFLAGVNQVIPYEAFGGDGMLTRLLLKASATAPWSDNGSANHAPLLPLDKLAKGQYFYQVELDGNASGKQGQDLLEQLRANGTHTYTATVKVYGSKDGKADLTNVIATRQVKLNLNGLVSTDKVKDSVANNIKETTDVPASYLENAKASGPFLAGVNQVIPYEAFGGDGMLTRLLLKASATAPWSDNGSANHAPLLPLDKLAKGQYFYQVELDGNASGKQGQDLLEQLRANGTHTYTATIKVYGSKDGQADLTNVVATRQVKLNLNGLVSTDKVKDSVTNNIKETTDVPASYLENAKASGPFLAGVNQVIPYEAFGGDGMLTRLLLKASATAPWSDNGSANHAPLLPLDKLAKGQYFYQVELDGNASGKQGQDLLEQLRANGTHTYTATVKVYGSKDGKADLTNVIATRQVKLNLNGIATSSSKQNGRPTLPSVSNHRKPDKGMDSGKMHLDKQMDQGTMKKDSQKPNNQVRATSKHAANGKTKQKEKSMLPYTGESKTSMAIIGIFGLALAGLLGSFGLKGRKEEN